VYRYPLLEHCLDQLVCGGDTTTPHGRLMLTVLGGLAEFERELIKATNRPSFRGISFRQ
jgi:DNA invertase Pin-like site-specific DNA recombinase